MSLVHLEQVVGKKVRDVDGKLVGRLEEIHGDWRGGECVVTYYAIAPPRRYVLRQLGMTGSTKSILVTWDRMDWSDTEKPRLTCRASELPTLE